MSEAKIITRTADDRRRVQLPDTCPIKAPLTVQEIDQDTWLVRRVKGADMKGWILSPGCECENPVLKLPFDLCAHCGKSWQLKKPSVPDATVKGA